MSPYTELTRHTLIGFCCHKDTSEWCLANGHWPPNILVHDVARAVWQFQYLWLVHPWKTNVQPPPPQGGHAQKILIGILAIYNLPCDREWGWGEHTNCFSECVMHPPKKMLSFPGLAGKLLPVGSQQVTSPGIAAHAVLILSTQS